MADTSNEEEYYQDAYYDDYYEETPRRTWSTPALVLTGCVGLILGFICAACISLILGAGLFLMAPVESTTSDTAHVPETALEWARVLRQAGLEVENPQDLASIGEQLPPGASSGIRFDMPSYCDGCGGKLVVFESAEYAAPMAEWLQSLGQYAYSRGEILIQIDPQVPREVALQYWSVLMEY
jgi:hypothetical protein